MISIQMLIGFMILAAIIAVEANSMIASVIALGTVGLGLSLAFLLLKAPDLAVILLIIEVLTLTVLLTTISRGARNAPLHTNHLSSITMGAFIALFLAVGYLAVQEIPAFGSPVMAVSNLYLRDGLALTGAANIVAAVSMQLRSYDSFAALIALFLVAVGVVHITSGDKKP